MKQRITIVPLILSLLTFLLGLSGCSSEEAPMDTQGSEEPTPNETVRVGVRIRPMDASATRAWSDNQNARDEEMMNVWTVVVVGNDDNKVKAIHYCLPPNNSGNTGTDKQREIDDAFSLVPGNYRFYSFVNISPSVVLNILRNVTGITTSARFKAPGDNSNPNPDGSGGSDPTGGGNTPPKDPFDSSYDYDSQDANIVLNRELLPSAEAADPYMTQSGQTPNNEPQEISIEEFADKTITAEAMNAVAVGVSAKGLYPANVNSHDNHFGATGIPMTNVQTLTIVDDDTYDLVVVRTYAKIKLQIYNESGSDIKITKVQFSDITRSQNNNYKLLPNLTERNDMENYHGDIKTNLFNDEKGIFSYDAPSVIEVSKTGHTTSGTPVDIEFYLNESSAPINLYGRFFFAIGIQGIGDTPEYRYALISGTNQSGKTGSWDYIARNDYRIIPVVLDDYKLDLIPYDFPAIGVYPCSVVPSDRYNTITFHDYGHFHLVPKVTKISDPSNEVKYSTSEPSKDANSLYTSTSWRLISNRFVDSWKTWKTPEKKTEEVGDDGGFYRSGSTATIDGDDVGGVPVWYENTTTPQWSPDGGILDDSYPPFIFGYIADPGMALTADKSVYHEFTIELFREGTNSSRPMISRLYMVLDKNQMSYARHRASAHRRTHDMH